METETSPLEGGKTGAIARANGAGWVAAWLQPEVRGNADSFTNSSRLLSRSSLAVFKVVEENVSTKGLGALRLYHHNIPIAQGYDPDGLAGFIADSVRAVGSQIELNRWGLRQLAESLPLYEDAQQEAESILQDHAALESLYSSAHLYPGNYETKRDWQFKLIFPGGARRESYGFVWTPRAQANRLVLVDETERHALDATHLCVDALASKYRLFTALGFDSLIERDRERIDRWLIMQERAA